MPFGEPILLIAFDKSEPIEVEKGAEQKMKELCENRRARQFNYSIKEELGKLLQRTKAFRIDEELSQQFLFACVVQDRLQDAIGYLDAHLNPPETVEEFYLFMLYADNVFSAVQEFFSIKVIKNNVPYPFSGDNQTKTSLEFFSSVFKRAFPECPASQMPSDDDFFKYLRALCFAHPYETSRQKFIDKKNGERHYSPFPLTRKSPGFPIGDEGDIGIVVYSNGEGKSISATHFTITLRYSTIKDFIISRYNTLADITKYIKGLLSSKEKSWLSRKIDRNKPLHEVLAQLHSIYEERLEEPYYIEEFVHHLETQLSPGHVKNEITVKNFKDALQAILPSVCDAVDKGDYNAVACAIEEVISAEIPDWPECPGNGYRGLNYYYGNVVVACTECGASWRHRMSVDLSLVMKGYASKWVEIDLDMMPNDEILLLLSAARWMESAECRKNGMFPRKRISYVCPYFNELDCSNNADEEN